VFFTIRAGPTNPLKVWHESVVRGTSAAARKPVVVTLFNQSGTPLIEYVLDRAWPSKIVPIERTTSGMIEKVTFTHDGLEAKKP
jgi:hypothetical protein